MADKVKPLKMEDTTSGTQSDGFPVETNPTQDYLAAKGVAFENNDSRLIDLSASGHIQFKDAIETAYITVRQLRTALNNIFDNTSNSFVATTVQAAIEEARDSAIAKARWGTVFTINGTVVNNTWLGFDALVPSDTTPIIVPRASNLVELGFSFAGANVDGEIKIYKNGTGAGQLVYTMTLTNANVSKLDTGVNVSFAAGDLVRAHWTDTGDNPSDASLQFYFQTT